jgi:hypothetical protein
MVTSLSSGILANRGHLLENLVFAALRRVAPEVFYLKTATGRELDFVVPRRGQEPWLVQVCESLADPRTRKREVSALGAAMAATGCASATIVTRGEDEQLPTESGTILVVPAWRFLLGLPDDSE